MEIKRMLRELRSVKTKEKDKRYHTFDTDVYSMVSDVIPKIEKLLQYEKLEEQLGMPLDVWHYIYDFNTIYFIGNEKEVVKLFLNDDFINKSFACSRVGEEVVYVTLHASDYKKYWFIYREEAEKKLEEMKSENTKRDS